MESKEDKTQMTRIERIARLSNISLIELYGRIGVISTSSGMCMATIDMINHFGGTASNFADLGGAKSIEQFEDILELLDSNKNTKVILINCFSGYTDMFEIARVIETSLKHLTKPLVIRLRGEHEDKVIEKLNALKTQYKELYMIRDFTDAVEQAVIISKRS